MKKNILIVMHKYERPLDHSDYVIRYLMNQWQQQGHTVRIAYGTGQKIDADIVINHVNLTVTPAKYIHYFKPYRQKINSAVTDISKSKISNCVIKPGTDYTGPVIVKTDYNCGGKQEKNGQITARILAKIKYAFIKRINQNCAALLFSNRKQCNYHNQPPGYWKHVKTLNNKNYPIFDRPDQLPGTIWKNKHLVVEKFMPELDADGKFICRYLYFFGDKSFGVITRSEIPVAKSRIIDRRILPGPGPEELLQYCKKLKMDYGRLDYTMVDQRVYLFDANRTPTFSPAIYSVYKEQIDRLSEGINAYQILNVPR